MERDSIGTNPTDEDLIQSVAREGDRAAFAEIYRRHGRAAFNVSCHVLHDRDAAEDVVQEMMLEIWSSARTYRPGNARGWIMGIVTHLCFQRLKRARREGEVVREQRVMPTGENDSPEQGLQREETLAALRRAVGELSHTEQQLVALHYGAGIRQSEIASMLSMPPRTVSSKIEKVLSSLRGHLTRAGFAAGVSVLGPELISEVVCEGISPSPDLLEKVLKRLPDGQSTGAGAQGSKSLPKAATSGRIWLAILATVSVIGLTVGAWWVRRSPDHGRSSKAPKAAVPLLRSWDFDRPGASADLKVYAGAWRHVAAKGMGGSGCMEVPERVGIRFEFPIERLPIMIEVRMKAERRPGAWNTKAFWLPNTGVASFRNAGKPVKVGGWRTNQIYVTRDTVEHRVDNQRSSLMVIRRQEGASLVLSLWGSHSFLVDDLTIREVSAKDIPDVNPFLDAIERIKPENRTGLVAVPDLKSPQAGKKVLVEFLSPERTNFSVRE